MGLALVGLLLGVTVGCRQAPSDEGDPVAPSITPVPVTAATARSGTLDPSVDLLGTLVVIPEETATIASWINQRIDQVLVVEGSEVHASDTLVRLDSRQAEIEYSRTVALMDQKSAALNRLLRGSLPAEIEVAKQEAEKAKYAADALRLQLEALKPLVDRKELSPVQYTHLAASLNSSVAAQAAAEAHAKLVEQGPVKEEIDQARAELAAAQADLAAARLNVELCNITSPIDGTVTRLTARVGTLATPGTSLATVMNLSQLFAQVRVPSAYQSDIQIGSRVEVSVLGESMPGKIARINPEADPTTGDIEVFGLVDNPQRTLRPGFACRVRVWLSPLKDATIIPAVAVADREGTPVVTVIRDGKAYEVAVTLGRQARAEIQVLEGLTPGDVVATSGGYGLPDGCPVAIQNEAKSEKHP